MVPRGNYGPSPLILKRPMSVKHRLGWQWIGKYWVCIASQIPQSKFITIKHKNIIKPSSQKVSFAYLKLLVIIKAGKGLPNTSTALSIKLQIQKIAVLTISITLISRSAKFVADFVEALRRRGATSRDATKYCENYLGGGRASPRLITRPGTLELPCQLQPYYQDTRPRGISSYRAIYVSKRSTPFSLWKLKENEGVLKVNDNFGGVKVNKYLRMISLICMAVISHLRKNCAINGISGTGRESFSQIYVYFSPLREESALI